MNFFASIQDYPVRLPRRQGYGGRGSLPQGRAMLVRGCQRGSDKRTTNGRPYGGTWVCTVGAGAQPMAGPEQARVGGRFGYRPYGVPWVCLAGAGTSQAFPQWGEHKDADCHDSDIGHCLAMTELRSSCRQSVDSLNPGGAWRAARVCYPYYAFTTVFFSSALPHSSHTPGG